VFVYQLREDGDGYRRGAYDPLPRRARRARGPAQRMQIALAGLVRGPTPHERRAGYTSAFSPGTAEVVLRTELRGRRAVVDFGDFRREHGEWGTSYGGSVFLTQLTRTIFQFRRVRSILFRIDGSCERFWTFLQAGGCEIVHRRGPRSQRR
jgi:spore germination protein GerM